ncbi:hypothetical protein N8D56_26355 (plasmid) [Devosia sp. A8/3-2]|nr:hypothetical protein N8D56_26355 [Devosia sp. A8/3-2]
MDVKPVRNSLLALTLVLMGGAPIAADDNDVNQTIDQQLGDHTKYQAVIEALQTAVAARDAKGVAALVDYPIGVAVGGKEMNIKTAKAFEENYAEIITPTIAKVITEQKYADLFVNYKGIMFGDGQVWISGICNDDECKSFDVKIETIQDGP